MTSLQAQSRTAACPLLAYPNLKSIMISPAKLVLKDKFYADIQFHI